MDVLEYSLRQHVLVFEVKHTSSNQEESSLTPSATRLAQRIVAFFIEIRGILKAKSAQRIDAFLVGKRGTLQDKRAQLD